MFRQIAKALGIGHQADKQASGAVTPTPTADPGPGAYEESLIVQLVNASPYIRPDARSQVIDHLMRRKRLFEGDTLLTLEEKRQLGLNTRQKIHRDLLSILSDEGLKCDRPSGVIGDIGLAARINTTKYDNIIKMSAPGLVCGVKIVGCDSTGDTPCAWSVRNAGKVLPASEATEAQRMRECDCRPYCKGYYDAVLPDL